MSVRLLLAITSGYYHINPSHQTIFLDMIFVVSVNTIIFSYFVNKKMGIFVYLLGLLSVFYWREYDDMRLYEFLKISIPIYFIYKISQNNKVSGYSLPLLLLFILFRYSTSHDKDIYKLTNNTISGHTLKHIIGGINIYIVIIILKKIF